MTEIAAAFTNAARSSVNLVVSPLLRKHPGAKVVWPEGGIGWIPAAIERADRQWDRHQYWTHLEDASVKPSDVARESMYFCMIEEPVGIKYATTFVSIAFSGSPTTRTRTLRSRRHRCQPKRSSRAFRRTKST